MKKHTILIVDDEANVLSSIRRTFRREDYEILTADSGSEGLKLLETNNVHLIISDQKMPGMTGIEFFKIVKEKYPNTIRIILTGYSDVHVAVEAINEGDVYKFLAKPWKSEDLKVTISRALEHFDLQIKNIELLGEIQKQNEELKNFNIKLERLVEERTKELSGRDRILQHLLLYHPLDETVNVFAEVAVEIANISSLILYTFRHNGHIFSRYNRSFNKTNASSSDFELSENVSENEILLSAYQSNLPYSNVDNKYAIIPISRGNSVLGIIIIFFSQSEWMDKKIEILQGIGNLISLSISDALLEDNIPEIQNSLSKLIENL